MQDALRTADADSATIENQVLDILSALTRPAKNLPDYHQRLLTHADRYLRIGAFAALLGLDSLLPEHWDSAVALAEHGCIARRGFNFFLRLGEYDRCKAIAAIAKGIAPPEPAEEMRAALAMDWRAVAAWRVKQFLASGDVVNLIEAADDFEKAGGWREALPWAARAAALYPADYAAAWTLLRILEDANQFTLLGQVLDVFKRGEVFPIARRILRAAAMVREGKPREAIDFLATLAPQTLAVPALRERYYHDLGIAHEKLGKFREAADYFRRKNAEQVGDKLDPAAFMRSIEALARVNCGPLPDDPRTDCFMMLGFPRSGTTLLENALAAHPAIETFEEVSSLERPTSFALDALETRRAEPTAAFVDLRRRYYAEIDRSRKKPGATILVDKMPIRSARIVAMEKLFPAKKYIFSIRHPFDVVLSCYKQLFAPNAAMENFREFRRACALYDKVMSIWFGVFPGETDRVLYVRYDDLVLHFEREVRRTLDFLGVAWSEEVLSFAEKSETRAAKTPSYAKVRSGLSIGVQSAWRNYRFLFDTRDAEPLYKWVDRFGYERA